MRAKKDGLNLVPFIDIMLVLLCIVLSISTFIAQGKIEVELPKSESGVKKTEEKPILIAIDENSKIYFDDVEVSKDDLKSKIADIDDNKLIVLKSDKNAKFDSFVSVIDILKLKKHQNFAIQTEVLQNAGSNN